MYIQHTVSTVVRSLTSSVELAPTGQLHSTDLFYAYDNNQCERNWLPETTLLLDQEVLLRSSCT